MRVQVSQVGYCQSKKASVHELHTEVESKSLEQNVHECYKLLEQVDAGQG